MKSKLLDELIRTRTVIPAISDTIFKRLMMEHLDYLGYILENIMPLTQEEVMKGEFLMNELPSNHLYSKSNRLDLVLKVRNYIINIEANKSINLPLLNRNRAHFAGIIFKNYSDKVSDMKYLHYQINFNGKNYLKNEEVIDLKYYDKYLNVGEKNFRKIHLNLEKVNYKYYNKEKINRFEKALLLLKLTKEDEILELVKGDSLLENVAKDIISYSRAREIVDAYENEMIEENYRRQSIEYATKQAVKRGTKNGIKEGIKEGIKKGVYQNKKDTALSMLKDKIPIFQIAKYTNLSVDEIKKLR